MLEVFNHVARRPGDATGASTREGLFLLLRVFLLEGEKEEEEEEEEEEDMVVRKRKIYISNRIKF